jgi:hypothetical protein
MRIYFLYFVSGGIFFFQSYYSFYGQPIIFHSYGWSTYSIIASGILFFAGYIFLYHQKIGSSLAFASTTIILIHHSKVYNEIIASTKRDGLDANNILYIICPVTLQLLILLHSSIYILMGSKRMMNEEIQKKYFPTNVNKDVAAIVGSAMIIVTVGVISILILFTGVVKNVERDVTWALGQDKFQSSKKVLFIFKDYPNYFIEFYSTKLAEKLKLSNKEKFKINITFVTDFGNLKGYKVMSIEGDESSQYGFHILNMECGNGYPECKTKPMAPWEEK